uniref:Tetratricopeptide repeat protein n=1 Tax=Entomoneis paludosa TaxID=265537 RepID=A0A7S3DTD8_9STRA
MYNLWTLCVTLSLLTRTTEAWSPLSSPGRQPIQPSPSTSPCCSTDDATTVRQPTQDRRSVFLTGLSSVLVTSGAIWSGGGGAPSPAWAEDAAVSTDILTQASGDVKKFFNEGRALEQQGNMAAAQRLYNRVVQIEPQFIYGWSNLGNTQTAFGDLSSAEDSYSQAIDLCTEQNRRVDAGVVVGQRKCNDLYLLLLNRGSLRLNNGQADLALKDLTLADSLRGRPDALILQNLARAKELNGYYSSADRDYTVAISMTANEVNPFWLRSAMIKFQIGDAKSAMDLLKRVENRFPEAPEVRAAYAVLLSAKGETTSGQQKFLEIPDRARLKYVDATYLTQTIAWPPAMRDELAKITKAVGDASR